MQQSLVIEVAADLVVTGARLRLSATLIATRGLIGSSVRIVCLSTPMTLLTAALLMLGELALIHLGDALDFLQSDRALAQGTARIDHEPLFDACGVEVMANVARKRRY